MRCIKTRKSVYCNKMSTEIRTSLSDRLRAERDRLGLSQPDMAALGDVKPRTYQDWERGIAAVSAEFLSVAGTHGLDASYVITGRRNLTGAAPAPDSESDAVRVPLFSATGSMGQGNDLITEDVILGDVPVSRHWLQLNVPRTRPEALKMIHAYGDSMLGTLNSGDFALVDTDRTNPDVDGVYVLQAGGQLFIKRVTRRLEGGHVVSSDNPTVQTTEVLNGSQQVSVLGRVVYGWNGRRL